MNDNPFTHLKNDPAYSLSEQEKRDMRTKLIYHMQTTPTKRSTLSVVGLYISRTAPALFALVLIISTTSVSFAASGALPGEVLYPLKTKVNEKIELALASSPEAKAVVHVRQAEERLREVEVLAVRGDVDEELIDETALSVARLVESAQEASALLEEEGDVVAAESIDTRVSVALDAHAQLLDAHADNFEADSADALRSLAVSLQGALEEEEQDVIDADDLWTRTEVTRARAEERITKLKAFLKKNGIPEETEIELDEEYGSLAEDLSEGDTLRASDNHLRAIEAYERIERRAHRALTWLASAQEISEETDQEVVIVFEDEEESTALAARAKTAEPETATLMMALDAVIEEPQSQGLFQLRDEE